MTKEYSRIAIGARKLVEYTLKAEEFFWREDACPTAGTAEKAQKIYGAISLASNITGVTHQEVANIMNRTQSRDPDFLYREVAGSARLKSEALEARELIHQFVPRGADRRSAEASLDFTLKMRSTALKRLPDGTLMNIVLNRIK